MLELGARCAPVSSHGRRWRRGSSEAAARLLLVLALGFMLGSCTIPFGNGGEPTSRSPEETRRDRNRLYTEEQERMERERTFDRIGPSDR